MEDANIFKTETTEDVPVIEKTSRELPVQTTEFHKKNHNRKNTIITFSLLAIVILFAVGFGNWYIQKNEEKAYREKIIQVRAMMELDTSWISMRAYEYGLERDLASKGEVPRIIETMQDPPNKYKKAYAILMDLYSNYKMIVKEDAAYNNDSYSMVYYRVKFKEQFKLLEEVVPKYDDEN